MRCLLDDPRFPVVVGQCSRELTVTKQFPPTVFLDELINAPWHHGTFIRIPMVPESMPNTSTTRWTDLERFSTAIAEAVAERVDSEPTALDPPLYESVDPDALDALLTSLSENEVGGSVSFSYFGFDVVVHADGTVSLETRPDASDARYSSTSTSSEE